ncbi:DNA methyltransferase [Lactiplantibacillus argentoratensis]|uniref:site-specific DNA-methyltransferase n=1 Tax=Lactiplantibacillus argentoratensis TaxID=271881 RepID=UPI003F52F7A0
MQTDNEKYNETVQPNTAFLNELKEKLPEFFAENGSFDIDKFKNQLDDNNINELSEGYQLNFIGKNYARRQAGEMPTTVIVPDEKQNEREGKNSSNLFFTGDNLEVLRHLQTAYANKVDVIYIDPPYNTGKDDFVYPDNFEYSDDKLKEMFGLNDDQLSRLKSIQGKASHSAWLTFMYPRLALSKKLLSNDGVIFTSIDDNEQANLKLLMDEVFGEDNFVADVTRIAKRTSDKGTHFRPTKDHILVYGKYISLLPEFGIAKSVKETDYKFTEANGRKYKKSGASLFQPSLDSRPNQRYYIEAPDGSLIIPPGNVFPEKKADGSKIKPESNNDKVWRWSVDTYIKQKEKLIFTKGSSTNPLLDENGNQSKWNIYPKVYFDDDLAGKLHPEDVIYDFPNSKGTKEILQLDIPFSFAKPSELIKYLGTLFDSKGGLFLDFFAGSSTTADAVMQLNAEDGGHRKFIMVQLPEKTYHTDKDGKEVPTKGGKAAYDAGFRSIDQISRERIRRAAKKIREDNELTLPENFDGSFKHYRVVKPIKQTLENIEDFDPNNTNLFTNMVDGFSSQSLEVAGDTAGEDTILTTWLAKDGYSFDTNVEEIKFGNYTAHQVENNRLYLINEGWGADQTRELLNQLGTHQLEVQSVVLFGYSFNVAELRELENGLKQLDSKVTLIKRY